ncbi:MAG TPA: DUF952 domain-containing protein [Polyangiaceae bacterium]|nr:DUF952 domain-containing protein [Polyangiaceae bacterium]
MPLYRILPRAELAAAETEGVFRGSSHDVRDGFIHLSAAHQVRGTLAAHYAGRADLVLLVVDGEELVRSGGRIEWEPSRGGERFPHLYGPLPLSRVTRRISLELDASGEHVLPPLA